MAHGSVRIQSADAVAADAMLWRWRGNLSLTVVVKISFAMVADAEMEVVPPTSIFTKELHHRNNPARSIRATPDLVPFLRRADVLLTGHAFAPRGDPTEIVPVRLQVVGAEPSIDKTLHVRGELVEGVRKPFESVPLVYERALGGPGWDENPFGLGATSRGLSEPDAAQIIDPTAPRRTAGFGPISSGWPSRKRLLGNQNRRALQQPIWEIADDFDWSYLQTAPRDQQVDYLQGDEQIVLEGVHPELDRIATRLPAVRAAVTVCGLDADPAVHRGLEPKADILRIDADHQACSLVFRCSARVRDEKQLAVVVVKAGLIEHGERVWPEEAPAAAPVPVVAGSIDSVDPSDFVSTLLISDDPEHAPPEAAAPSPLGSKDRPPPPPPDRHAEKPVWLHTADLDDADLPIAPDMPFLRQDLAAAPPRPPGTPIPGAPWSEAEGSPKVSLPIGDRTADLILDDASLAPPHTRTPAGVSTPKPAPARTTDAIRFVYDGPFVAFAFPCQVKPRRDALVVVVKATCAMGPDGPITPLDEPDPPSGNVHVGDDPMHTLLYPDDFAVFKPRADVLLTGHAYARDENQVSTRASFSFGRQPNAFARTIAVFGARTWQSMAVRLWPSEPLAFKKVPLVYERAFGGPGVDANPVGLGKAGDQLPQLEDPADLVESPSDAPAPVCFGGVPPLWHERAQKTGTYDASWRRGRWPYFPADLDWSYFQAAPSAQQLDFLAGDEPFEIVGMHPDHVVLRGSLPRIRARCFAQKTQAAGGTFHEVILRLDTATFDIDAMKAHIVWRGLLEVRDDEASELAEMFVLAEPTSGPRVDIAAARAAYEAARTPWRPQPEPSPPALAPSPPPAFRAPDPPALGKDTRAALAAGATLERRDLSGADLRDADLSGQSLAGCLLKGAMLRGAKLAGADLTDAVLSGADLTDADCKGANVTRADFTSAFLEGASFEGATLTGALFSRARAARARFSDAKGERARFVRTFLGGARFERAQLAGCDFSGARLDGGVFDGAKVASIRLYDATGERVSFKEADMTGARADETRLEKSDFSSITAPGSVWDRAKLSGSTFQDAMLVESGFVKARCERCLFAGADLSEARLGRADLAGASFVRANLMKAQLAMAILSGADLRGANLHGAETHRAKLDRARLEDAIVTGTKLAGGHR